MALFTDAGQVAPAFSSIDVKDFRKTYGVGMSFHTPVESLTTNTTISHDGTKTRRDEQENR